jgi:tetratricopeptide (TPR) repeat protein
MLNSSDLLIQHGVHEDVILANSQIKNGEIENAKKTLESLVFSGNHQSFIYEALGEVCKALDDKKQAKRYFNLAIQLAELDNDFQVIVTAKAELGRIHFEEALDHFNVKLTEAEKIDGLKRRLNIFNHQQNVEMKLQHMSFLSKCKACQAGNIPGRFTGANNDCIGC